MKQKDAYLVIDIGTGNVRVAVVEPGGEVLGVARDDIRYYRDELYPESIRFDPDELWSQIVTLGRAAIAGAGDVVIKAFTTTSQREGIVMLDSEGTSLVGMPNIDHRGREWESGLQDKSRVYQLAGRYPTSLFSVYKLIGIRDRRGDIWQQFSVFLSISDWAAFRLTGIAVYEHSQASETLLYDVQARQWSDELCGIFAIDKKHLPPLSDSGNVIGKVLKNVSAEWNVPADAVVVTGGGDTQLAIKSTQPAVEDIVIVSGTTTPIVKLVNKYITDAEERTWTSRDIEKNRFVFEANAGVTGLNYQRLKEVFYPNEGYDVIEKELAASTYTSCTASLGSLIATEKKPLTRGGFIFPAPVPHELTRSSFVWATLIDIAFSITENYNVLKEVAGHRQDYIWACGGGLQSKALRQLIANITGKKVQVRNGFEQSSAVGGALLCNDALGLTAALDNTSVDTSYPQPEEYARVLRLYEDWKKTRDHFKTTC